MSRTKTTSSAKILVVRIAQDHLPCFIAGAIVNTNALQFRSVKDFKGVGIFHNTDKSAAHLSACPNCPPEDEVIAQLPNDETQYDNYQKNAKFRKSAKEDCG